MNIDFDFRLLDVSLELYALEDFLETMEKQIDLISNIEKIKLEDAIRKHNLNPDGWDYVEAKQNYEDRIEFLLPRFFRGPFLVSLYAVYEAAVTEIAHLIQKRKGQAIALGDIRGNDFLDQAKKYYRHILQFELCDNNAAWQQIIMLSEIRNAIAHTNGRLEMLKKTSRDRILNWEKGKIGIESHRGYILVDRDFVRNIFSSVQTTLSKLVERYKQWDSSTKSA